MTRQSLRNEVEAAIHGACRPTITDEVDGTFDAADAVIAIFRRRQRAKAARAAREDEDRLPRQGSKCPRWGTCGCVTQGYVNRRERGGCGLKPPKWRK